MLLTEGHTATRADQSSEGNLSELRCASSRSLWIPLVLIFPSLAAEDKETTSRNRSLTFLPSDYIFTFGLNLAELDVLTLEMETRPLSVADLWQEAT